MKNDKKQTHPLEPLFWSIALPGFGQLLNRKYFKGVILIALEFLINIQGNINLVIMKSFLGEINEAIEQANFLWLMFYPCIYIFAIWDAYRDAGGGKSPFSFIPFVSSAYLGTIGVIYSTHLKIYGHLIGPVFLPILFMIGGALIGRLIQKLVVEPARKV